MARTFLDAALGPDVGNIRLEGAGTRAVAGAGTRHLSATVLSGLGGDPGDFTARQLTDDMATVADLNLVLTRAHRRAVLERTPRALSRTFTLVEAADLADLVPADRDIPGESLADRCRSLVREMAVGRARRPSDAGDDIPDSVGESAGFHEQVGDAIATRVLPLVGRFADLSAHWVPGERAAASPLLT